MDEVYIVVKRGVYIQDIFGPFEHLDIARGFAAGKASTDKDSYHDWLVFVLSDEGLKDQFIKLPLFRIRKREVEDASETGQ